jgi:hypoxanthine phosphoribosyltransferase
MNEKLYISWEELNITIDTYLDNLPAVDYIIALSRGGNIPATLLSYKLKTNKIIFITTELYDPLSNEISDKVKIKTSLCQSDISRLNNCKTVLIVDDILDSGETLESVNQYLTQLLNPSINIINFTIFKKSSAIKRIPEIYQKTFSPKILTGDEWIVFPWD